VPYTCRKCIKDQINFRVLKKKKKCLSRAVSNRITMFMFLLEVTQQFGKTLHSTLRSHEPTNGVPSSMFPDPDHSAVTSNLVQLSHVEIAVVKRFKSLVLPQTPELSRMRKEVKTHPESREIQLFYTNRYHFLFRFTSLPLRHSSYTTVFSHALIPTWRAI